MCIRDRLVLDFLWMTERHDLCRPAHLVAQSPEVAARMEVRATTWPLLIAVSEVDPHTRCAKRSRLVGEFARCV